MTNISRDKIDKKDYRIITNKLAQVIASLNKTSAQYLLNDLLTESEQIMIVKRFGAMFMFEENYSPYRVSQTLGISRPTASRIYQQFTMGCYTNLLSCLRKKERNNFLELLHDLMIAQASPKARARLLNRALS